MSAADGLPRKEEDGSAILSTLTISGRQADTSWLHLSRKQDRLKPRSEHYRRLPPTPNSLIASCAGTTNAIGSSQPCQAARRVCVRRWMHFSRRAFVTRLRAI